MGTERPGPRRYVVDIGNTRLKWATVGPDGVLGRMVALPVEEHERWPSELPACSEGERWAIASVRPPVAERLEQWLEGRPTARVCWYRSAADVPLRHALTAPERTGVDRALAVYGALQQHGGRGPGIVVSCGTAVTVDRVGPDGTWQGGAIAPGWRSMALALNQATAQLPVGEADAAAADDVPALGTETATALRAGLYWGQVGVVRELIERQQAELDRPSWVVWTGGDAPWVSAAIEDSSALLVPNLALLALAWLADGLDRVGP